MKERQKGTVYVLVCVALWALIPVAAKLGQSRLDHHQFLFWSSLVSFLALSTAAWAGGQWRTLKTFRIKTFISIGFLGLLGTYIYYLLLYLGYARTAGLEVLVVQYTWPLWVVLLSVLILGERLNRRKLLALTLGFIGVLLVLSKGKLDALVVQNGSVILLVLTGAFCFALFSVLSKRVQREPLVVVSLYFLTATLAALISMLLRSRFVLPSGSALVPILLNGILVNGFSYLFWQWALKAAPASFLAPFVYLTPVLSALYLILFFNAPLSWAAASGLLLVVLGGWVNSRGQA